MSVASLSTASLDKLFLEFIKPGIDNMVYTNTVLVDRFETDVESCVGKYGVAKLLTATAKSARPSSSSTFPTAKQSTYAEFTMYMKRGMYASLQFDGLAMAAGKGKGAVKELIAAETESISLYAAHKLNKQFWGDGSGRLAQVKDASANSTSVTVDGPLFGQDANEYTNPSQYLFEGMSVDIYDGNGNLEVEDIDISSIALGGAGTDTLTMASAVTCSADSWIFDHDTYASAEAAGTGVPMGMHGIVNTANATVGITATTAFQGINRSTYTYAQGQLFNMASAAITNKKMLEAVHKLERYGTIDVIITNDVIWRNYYQILESDKTMPNTTKYWGGTSGLAFYGGRSKEIPIIWDEDCPDGRMYFLDSKKFKVIAPEKGGLKWIPGTAGNVLSRVEGKDEFVAHMLWYYNFTNINPRSSGAIYAIKHAAS